MEVSLGARDRNNSHVHDTLKTVATFMQHLFESLQDGHFLRCLHKHNQRQKNGTGAKEVLLIKKQLKIKKDTEDGRKKRKEKKKKKEKKKRIKLNIIETDRL